MQMKTQSKGLKGKEDYTIFKRKSIGYERNSPKNGTWWTSKNNSRSFITPWTKLWLLIVIWSKIRKDKWWVSMMLSPSICSRNPWGSVLWANPILIIQMYKLSKPNLRSWTIYSKKRDRLKKKGRRQCLHRWKREPKLRHYLEWLLLLLHYIERLLRLKCQMHWIALSSQGSGIVGLGHQ